MARPLPQLYKLTILRLAEMKSDETYRRQMELKSKQAQELLQRIKSRHRKEKHGSPLVKQAAQSNNMLSDWFCETFNSKTNSQEEMIRLISENIQLLTNENGELSDKVNSLQAQFEGQRSNIVEADNRTSDRIRKLNQELQDSDQKYQELRRKNKLLQGEVDNFMQLNEELEAKVQEVQTNNQQTAQQHEKERTKEMDLLRAISLEQNKELQRVSTMKVKQLSQKIEELKSASQVEQTNFTTEKQLWNKKQEQLLSEIITKSNAFANLEIQASEMKDKLCIQQMQSKKCQAQQQQLCCEGEILSGQNQALRQELERISLQLKKVEDAKENSQAVEAESLTKTSELQARVSALVEETAAKEKALISNTKVIERLDVQVTVNKEEISALLDQREKIVSQYAEQSKDSQNKWQERFDSQLRELTLLSLAEESLQQENQQLSKRCELLLTSSQEKERKIKEIFTCLETSVSEMEGKQSVICSLEKELSELRSNVDTANDSQLLEGVQKDFEGNCIILQAKLSEATVQRDTVFVELERVEREFKTKDEEFKGLEGQLLQANKDVQDVNQQLLQACHQNEIWEQNQKQQEFRVALFKEENEILKKTVGKLEAQLQILASHQQPTLQKQQSNNLRAKSEKHIQTIQQLTEQLSEAYNKINLLAREIDRAKPKSVEKKKESASKPVPNRKDSPEKNQRSGSRSKSINKLASYFGFSG